MTDKLHALRLMINRQLLDPELPETEFWAKLAEAVARMRTGDVSFYTNPRQVSGYGR